MVCAEPRGACTLELDPRPLAELRPLDPNALPPKAALKAGLLGKLGRQARCRLDHFLRDLGLAQNLGHIAFQLDLAGE